jgi:polar amino acid transport system substrate-binding protein
LTQELDAGGVKPAEVLGRLAPTLRGMIERDRAAAGLFDFWAESFNFDENAKASIVHPAIMAAIGEAAGAPQRGKVVHAGLSHTYGYMLSKLVTPYGFKRARWTRRDLDDGLGLPRGTLGPAPREGTLLGNVTAAFGGIAFCDDPRRLADVRRAAGSVSAAAALALECKSLDVRRLQEKVSLVSGGDTRTVELRTDVVRLRQPPAVASGGNAFLLVYSLLDSARPGPRLITGFPVSQDYVDALFDPAKLGENQPVRVRYNGHVAELVDRELPGARSVTVLPEVSSDSVVLNDNPWPPFFFEGKTDGPPGIGKELLQRCLPAVGRRGVFVPHPIKRMRRNMETGELDINVYSYEPDRESFLLFGKEPVFVSEYRPVVRADSPIRITKITDFDSLRLGYLSGLVYSPEFKAYVEKRQAAGTLDITYSDESNIMKLIGGRLDVFVSSTPTVVWLAKLLGVSDKIKVLDFVVKRADYFVTFSKASKRLSNDEKISFLAAMDGCLRTLKKNGSHKEILARYGQR